MANTALLGGLLKGFGAAQAQQQAREFQADQTAKAQRLSILQAAATNPNLNPADLPGIFQQMEEIYPPGGRGTRSTKGGGGGKKALPPQQAPQQATQQAPEPSPPPPPSFLSRVGSGIEHTLGEIGSRLRAGATPQAAPPLPPMDFLTPEQRAQQAATVAGIQTQAGFTLKQQELNQAITEAQTKFPNDTLKQEEYVSALVPGYKPVADHLVSQKGAIDANDLNSTDINLATGQPIGPNPPAGTYTRSIDPYTGQGFVQRQSDQPSASSKAGQLSWASATVNSPTATPAAKNAASLTILQAQHALGKADPVAAIAGPQPTSNQYNGVTYPTTQAAQAAWGRNYLALQQQTKQSANFGRYYMWYRMYLTALDKAPDKLNVVADMGKQLGIFNDTDAEEMSQLPADVPRLPSGQPIGFTTAGAPTAQMRKQGQYAAGVLEQSNNIAKEISALDLGNQLGPLAGRWNDFMTGRLGVDNTKFAKLHADLANLVNAWALAHGIGTDTGRQQIAQQITAAQSPANLLAALASINTYANFYMRRGLGAPIPEVPGNLQLGSGSGGAAPSPSRQLSPSTAPTPPTGLVGSGSAAAKAQADQWLKSMDIAH